MKEKFELPPTPACISRASLMQYSAAISESVKAEAAKFDIKTKEGREGIQSLVFLLDAKFDEIDYFLSYDCSDIDDASEEISSLKMQITHEMREDDRLHGDLIYLIKSIGPSISHHYTLASTVNFYLNRLNYMEEVGFKDISLKGSASFDVREDMMDKVREECAKAKAICEKRLAEIKAKKGKCLLGDWLNGINTELNK